MVVIGNLRSTREASYCRVMEPLTTRVRSSEFRGKIAWRSACWTYKVESSQKYSGSLDLYRPKRGNTGPRRVPFFGPARSYMRWQFR